MTKKEYQRMVADARREAGRLHGFRQSSYINFIVADGYFFCLKFMNYGVRLTVKPMYADDLWWDIWDTPEYKHDPVSLRETGEYSLPGQVLASYDIVEGDNSAELTPKFERIFEDASGKIAQFLADNPDADTFYPDESEMDCDPDRLLYLITLIHNGRDKEALKIMAEERAEGHRCEFRRLWFFDSYTYISRWCKRKKPLRRLINWIDIRYCLLLKWVSYSHMAVSDYKLFDTPDYYNQRLFNLGVISAPLMTLLICYCFKLGFVWLFVITIFLLTDDGRRAHRYYAEFRRLPDDIKRKWKTKSWTLAIGLQIYSFGIIIIANLIRKYMLRLL